MPLHNEADQLVPTCVKEGSWNTYPLQGTFGLARPTPFVRGQHGTGERSFAPEIVENEGYINGRRWSGRYILKPMRFIAFILFLGVRSHCLSRLNDLNEFHGKR